MANLYVDVPLLNEPYYDLTISLEGNSYILEFIYNERLSLYTFSLFDSQKVPLVQGQALVPEYPLFLDYNLKDLSGYFYLTKKSDLVSEPYKDYPDQLKDYYYFMYIYTS